MELNILHKQPTFYLLRFILQKNKYVDFYKDL